MSSTLASENACPVDVDLVSNTTKALSKQANDWSTQCQRFLDWQRQCVLPAASSDDLRPVQEAGLKWLLAVGRILNAATSDPEFDDRRTSELVKGRMAQLRHSWEIAHPTMPLEDAETFLKKHFKPATG